VSDAHGCTCAHTYTVSQPSAPLSISTSITYPSGESSYDGYLSGSCSGGWGGYSWSWSNGCSSWYNSGIGWGGYSCTVTDAAGCSCSGSWSFSWGGGGYGYRTTNAADSNQTETQPKADIAESVKVYPNPTVGLFTVEVPSAFTTAHISVTDVTGKEVASREMFSSTGNTADFNLSNEAAGVYIVNIISGDKHYQVKLVVN